MHDYLPPIHINISGPSRRFLEKMAEIAEKSGSFNVEKHYDALGQKGFDIVNLRHNKQSPHTGLGAQLIAQPGEKAAIAVEIRAQQWSPKDSPSYETYCAEAKTLIAPLLATYNKETGSRHRMTIPVKEKLEPRLPPQCAKFFSRFVALANKTSLHPLDWRRFYEFVRDCRSRARYSEEEIARLLIKEGFSEKYANYIGDIYGHLCDFKRRI